MVFYCKSPNDGDIRIINKFLFLPLCINSELRWLEYVSITQKFVSYRSEFYPFVDSFWFNLKFNKK